MKEVSCKRAEELIISTNQPGSKVALIKNTHTHTHKRRFFKTSKEEPEPIGEKNMKEK